MSDRDLNTIICRNILMSFQDKYLKRLKLTQSHRQSYTSSIILYVTMRPRLLDYTSAKCIKICCEKLIRCRHRYAVFCIRTNSCRHWSFSHVANILLFCLVVFFTQLLALMSQDLDEYMYYVYIVNTICVLPVISIQSSRHIRVELSEYCTSHKL